MGDEFGADAAAAAAAILDHHRLAQRLADQIADYSPDNVGISSGRKRHNQMDGPVRIGGQGALRQGADPSAAINMRRETFIAVLLTCYSSLPNPGGVQGSIIVPPILLPLNPG